MTNRQLHEEAVPHAHLWPLTARDMAGRLVVAGCDIAALAREHGTPLYLYDEATIRAQCRAFQSAFSARWPKSATAYAGKAYLSPALCRLLAEEGMELDIVSAGELAIALAGGFPAARIHLHGNFKPEAELLAAVEAGLGRIVVDSLDELARVEAVAMAHAARVQIWLRVCPDVPTETHTAIQTGDAGSKFGLDLASGEVMAAAQRATSSPHLALVGLHAHAGSNLREVAPVARVVSVLADCAAALRDQCGAVIREISPGGGLGVAYTPEQRVPSGEDYAEAVAQALTTAIARHRLAPPRVIVEPGRAIVARAGIAVYATGPRKVTPTGAVTLAVDGGMGDNPRPALYGAHYHAALVERLSAPAEEPVRVVGRYCESGDILVESVMLPRAEPNELLAIPVSGAYHLSMASNYNQVARPAVLFLAEGHARLVRRRESVADLLRLEADENGHLPAS
jgi:diaminopimelate decarboxylase